MRGCHDRYSGPIAAAQGRRPRRDNRRRLASQAADRHARRPGPCRRLFDAVETANPDAQQIADRWHLLSNLREAVERLLIRQAPRLRQAAYSSSEALQMQSQPVTADTRATVLPLASWQRLSIDRRAARMACYEEAVRRRQLGESFKAIGHATNLDHRTVRNFVQAGSFPERAQRASGSTLLDGHRHYMASRVAEGCLSAAHVWQELRARGFAGSRSTVRDSMARARAAGSDGAGLSSKAPTVACPSPSRAYAWPAHIFASRVWRTSRSLVRADHEGCERGHEVQGMALELLKDIALGIVIGHGVGHDFKVRYGQAFDHANSPAGAGEPLPCPALPVSSTASLPGSSRCRPSTACLACDASAAVARSASKTIIERVRQSSASGSNECQ